MDDPCTPCCQNDSVTHNARCFQHRMCRFQNALEVGWEPLRERKLFRQRVKRNVPHEPGGRPCPSGTVSNRFRNEVVADCSGGLSVVAWRARVHPIGTRSGIRNFVGPFVGLPSPTASSA